MVAVNEVSRFVPDAYKSDMLNESALERNNWKRWANHILNWIILFCLFDWIILTIARDKR